MRRAIAFLAVACALLGALPGRAQHPAADPAVEPPAAPEAAPAAPPPPALSLTHRPFQDIPLWAADRHAEALPALLATCDLLRGLRPDLPLGGGGLVAERAGTPADWRDVCVELRALQAALPREPRPWRNADLNGRAWQRRLAAWRSERDTAVRQFLERRFDAYAAGTGIMTGYYEPVLRGALAADETFGTPLSARPPELVEQAGADEQRRRFGVLNEGRLEPFHDRLSIDRGALAGRGLELVWVDDAVDAFFLHIQGSGRVVLPDGELLRIGYAAQNGRSYVAIGRVLIERGEIARERMSMQAIRDRLREMGPERALELMGANPSYVFFRRVEGLTPDQGPIGALGVPLTPQRSVAVDRGFIPLGLPLFVAARDPLDRSELGRTVVAQDTGGAIRGPARTDFVWGGGHEAGERAGRMREEAQVFLLLPRLPEVAGAAP